MEGHALFATFATFATFAPLAATAHQFDPLIVCLGEDPPAG
jgi:hypothetical protein